MNFAVGPLQGLGTNRSSCRGAAAAAGRPMPECSLLPFVLFGALHLRNARRRPNRPAVRAGFALYASGLLLVLSGLVLTRLGGFEVRDPQLRAIAYWVHLVAPLLVIGLFLAHRLAGRGLRWRLGLASSGLAALACSALLLVQRPAPPSEGLAAASYAGDAFRPALARTADGGLIPARWIAFR